jgi:hypothetical protein
LTREEWQEHVELDARTGSVILARSHAASSALSGAGAPHLAGEAIDHAINLGAFNAPIPPLGSGLGSP